MAMPDQKVASDAPITVIIPCFRCSATIWRAIDSIVHQTQKPAEVILVEDASGDGTLKVLRSIEEQHSAYVKVIALKENKGAAGARNAGWDAARQPYIAFLDADDAWHPKKIEVQLGCMMRNPEYGLVGHAHVLLDGDTADWAEPLCSFQVSAVSNFSALLSNPFGTLTVMLKSKLPFRFKEGKRYIEDYLLWLQIILSGVPAAFINAPLAATFKADYGEDGLSAQLWKMELGELGAYWQIYKDGLVGLPLTLGFLAYSLIKYVRRLIIVAMRRLDRDRT